MRSQIFGKFFLGMAREETEEKWRDLDQGRGKGGIGTMRLMSARELFPIRKQASVRGAEGRFYLHV